MSIKAPLILALTAGLAAPMPVRAADTGDVVKGVAGVALLCYATGVCGGGSQAQPAPRASSSGSTRSQTRAPAAPRVDQTVKRDQQALNYFGFPAGAADGQSGAKTRSAISGYQAYMGYPATGQLSDYERSMLHSGYDRAQAGAGAAYPNVVAAEGSRGLLKAFAADARGERYTPPGAIPAATAPVPAPAPQSPAGLPDFGQTQDARSMAGHCQSVELLTQVNGKMMTPDAMSDPNQALDEQFCAARGYAISLGQQRAAAVQGVDDAGRQQQCRGLVETMAPETDKIAAMPPAQAIASAEAFATKLGAQRAKMVNIGEICMGIGYQTDNPEMVLASAALLIGAGERPYAEVYGHHLRQGFGVAADPAAATEWYRADLAALDGGAAPVFLPAQGGQRAEVIRAALAPQPAANAAVKLPDFGGGSN